MNTRQYFEHINILECEALLQSLISTGKTGEE